MTSIQLSINSGNLPSWSDQEAKRLSKLKTFQPKGWNAVGYARAMKGIKRVLREAGFSGQHLDDAIYNIIDMARLYALANHS